MAISQSCCGRFLGEGLDKCYTLHTAHNRGPAMDSRVVVSLTCRLYYHEDRDYFAARCHELGMSAYGKTQDEAVDNLKRHFNVAIRAYREHGKLESILQNSGVAWWWEDDYPDNFPAYEDTGVTSTTPLSVLDGGVHGHGLAGGREGDDERILAFAA